MLDPIRRLSADDADAYAAFREEMWPAYAAAGDPETVRYKYERNPHASLCPESGLYGFFQSGRLAGVMGAYPMPVTFRGTVHPGHLLVDWAVLPRFQRGPVAGRLFQTLLDLPGRKFASIGTSESQTILARRGTRIPATMTAAIVRPVQAALLEAFRLRPWAQPSPACAGPFALDGLAEPVAPEDLPAAVPPDAERCAYVHRGPDFWQVWCRRRLENGASPLRLPISGGSAHVVLRLLDAGSFRFAELLSLHLEPAAEAQAREAGKQLRAVLRKLGVCALTATETDPCSQRFLRSAGFFVVRRPTHWWALRKATDGFSAEEANWWLTSADRDSHWGGTRPSRASLSESGGRE